jgi:hypothetical protein
MKIRRFDGDKSLCCYVTQWNGYYHVWETFVPSACCFMQQSLEMSPHPGWFSAELWNSQIFMLGRRFSDCRVGDYFGFIAYSQMEDGPVCKNYIVMNPTNGICSKKKGMKKQDFW